jgi:hemerythrin
MKELHVWYSSPENKSVFILARNILHMDYSCLIHWDDQYSVGVAEIDAQHKRLIATIQVLAQSITDGTEAATLEGIFSELGEYAQTHFDTEERYMRWFAYAGYDEHKQEHEKFKQRLAQLIQERRSTRGREDDLSFELIDFLCDWLKNHLLELDRKYMDCFRANGLS